MSVTAPFHASVELLVRESHQQTVRVEVESGGVTYDFEPLDYSVDWDETRSPRVHASVDVAVPTSQEVLDAIDPRTSVRVRVIVGYRLQTGTLDEHVVADLGLRNRTVRRTDDAAVMTLTCASDEALVIDGTTSNPSASASSTWTASSLTAGITTLITDILAGTPAAAPAIVSTVPAAGAVTFPMEPHAWDQINDAADRFDIDVYDNGDRVFRIAPRAGVSAESALQLQTGVNGTVLSSETGISRDDWANWVVVWYRWPNTAMVDGYEIAGGQAHVLSGPFAPAASGYKMLMEVREYPGTYAGGAAAAATILRRMLARSRSYQLTAVPAWWVRPGHTITLQLPLGSQERHLVSRVGFRPNAMTIETRLPDTANTIGE